MSRYPDLQNLSRRARARLPRFVWEYLDSGTGTESVRARNRLAYDRITFTPRLLQGEFTPNLGVKLFGHDLSLPFGIAPVGMSGLIWPGMERALARGAAEAGIPYTLSTVAAASPEDVTDCLGPEAWFQLYPPRDIDVRLDTLRRAKNAGFKVLVLTADVPVASRRERLVRSGLTSPPKLTPNLMAQVALRPAWALATLRAGMPRMRTLDPYIEKARAGMSPTAHVGYLLRTAPDMDYVHWLREHWDGPLVVKGVLNPGDVAPLEAAGIDALWVSNHAGRQFDGAPASIDALPVIRNQTKLPLVFDSGIEGGLDILRALALGADFVILGRAWQIAVAALGPDKGPAHLAAILRADLESNMGNMGARGIADLPGLLTQPI